MDIKDMIAKVEEKIGDKAFQAELKKDPVKAVEGLLGVDLPDEQLKAVVAAAKAKLGSEDVAGIVQEAEEKLGDVLDDAKGLLGGLFGKKD